jgi:two-component system copper resistance phosphate regulon response regulator CusR
MNKLCLVEDDANLARSLVQGFGEHGLTVSHASHFNDARKRLENEAHDLVILDLGLPGGDGLDLLEMIQRKTPALPVIITTARGELHQRLRGLENGADDYLVKPYAFEELLARVRVVLRRAGPRPLETWQVSDLKIDTLTRRVTRADEVLDLTPREYDLLIRLVRAHGAVVTREMLAREVWHQRAWTASLGNAMDVHVSRLREKLDKNRPVPLLHTVRGVGFILKEQT